MPGTKKVSKRAKETPGQTATEAKKSTFKPNEELPEDASLMEKAKREAKKEDVIRKSAVLSALKDDKTK